MKKLITDYFDETVKNNKNKIIFLENKNVNIKYNEFSKQAKSIATYLSKNIGLINKPIAIFIDKSIDTILSMMSVLYSGNFYCVLDTDSPKNRLDNIINSLDPVCIITNSKSLIKLDCLGLNKKIINIDDISCAIENKLLKTINDKMISTDPAYVLFTSGSTGIPKGTVISHNAVISYIKWFIEAFNINNKTVFGNQTPFYFSMSVSDVYSTIFTGATLCIIPKMNFSFPINLIKYLNENKVNTIYWVPSALSIVSNFKTFDYIMPLTLEKVLFAGESMPMTTLNLWRKYLPKLFYANLYGPTETTDICTYYIVNRKFKNDESLPIGKPCNNCGIIIVKENGTVASDGEIGEIYVRGSFLGNGYYNNEEKTKCSFVQNPINHNYPEMVYKTGDLGRINKYGEIDYLGRVDFQVKHMGYRIELGEIENNINAIDDVNLCACIYDTNKKMIVLFYESMKLSENNIIDYANKKLVQYMRPNKVIKLNKMPFNANGKIDRVKLKQIYEEEE